MTTSPPVNIPTDSTAARVLEALEPFRLKREPSGQYRADCPWRTGSNSHSLRIKIKDGEYGAWNYFAGDGGGSLYDLAKRLNVPLPERSAQTESTKRAYDSIADYAEAHGLTVDQLNEAGIREGKHYCTDLRKHRPALFIKTPNGERVRYLDGDKPEYRSPSGYTKCWYRPEIALGLCKATGQPLVICNGEISTLAAQLRGIAATALAGGSEKGIPDPLIAELKAKHDGEVYIAFDSDTTGRDGARKVAGQLREAGMTVHIVDLNGPKGWDLADFVRLPGNDKPEALQALIVQETPENTTKPLFRWMDFDQLLAKPVPQWIVPGEIAAGKVTVMWGASGSGKTFLAVDYSMRVGQERPVLYIAAEDVEGVSIRAEAWMLHHQPKAKPQLITTEDRPRLLDPAHIDALIEAGRARNAGLIVIDTMGKSIVGADENSAKDMRLVTDGVERLATETGAGVLLIHHANRNGGYRGSGTLRDDAYAQIEVSNTDGLIKIESDKPTKNSTAIEPRFMRLFTVETSRVDIDSHEPIVSCVIVPEHQVMPSRNAPLTKSQREVLEILNLSVFRDIGAKSAQVRQECKIPMATIYRVLSELKERGYLEQSEKGDPFTITAAGIAALRGGQLSCNSGDNNGQLSQLSRDSHNSHDSSSTSLLSLSHTYRCESDESGDKSQKTDDPPPTLIRMAQMARPKVSSPFELRREIMRLGDPRSLKELDTLPLEELYALRDRLQTQHSLVSTTGETLTNKPDPMAEHNRDMQLMQEIKQLERAHNYFAARNLVKELPASQEAKQQLIDSINRKEKAYRG